MPEAQLKDSGSGLAPATEGWFVVNVRDAEWWSTGTRGAACWFESEYGEPPVEFTQLGIHLSVLEPGQPTLYHAESSQEAFLVLSGECTLLVEGEERLLRPWDFFHAPSWTEHAFVGAGDGPCVILMVGARGPEKQSEEWQVRYPASELAARYGASVEEETSDPAQAHTTAEWFRRERPPYWSRLPGLAPYAFGRLSRMASNQGEEPGNELANLSAQRSAVLEEGEKHGMKSETGLTAIIIEGRHLDRFRGRPQAVS